MPVCLAAVSAPKAGVHTTTTVYEIIEQPLPDGTAFQRVAIVAKLMSAAAPFAKVTMSPRDATTQIEVDIGAPEATLKEPEKYRQSLLDAWDRRVNALRTSVGATVIDLTNCAAPIAGFTMFESRHCSVGADAAPI